MLMNPCHQPRKKPSRFSDNNTSPFKNPRWSPGCAHPDSICHAVVSSSTYVDSPLRRCLRVLQPAAHTWRPNYHNICPAALGDNARVPMKRSLGLLIIVPSASTLAIPMLPESYISMDSPFKQALRAFRSVSAGYGTAGLSALGGSEGRHNSALLCVWGRPFSDV
jgi:hypothetical protein